MRVMIATERAIYRAGLRMLLEAEGGVRCTGEAATRDEVVQLVSVDPPDVLLLDPDLPGGGLAALRDIIGSGIDTRTLLLNDEVEQATLLTALRLGLKGTIAHDCPPKLLLKAMRTVMKGEFWLGRGEVRDLLQALATIDKSAPTPSEDSLTPRERDIVLVLLKGASNKEIASELGLGEQTVKNYLASIYGKLKVSNRVELVLYARESGLARIA